METQTLKNIAAQLMDIQRLIEEGIDKEPKPAPFDFLTECAKLKVKWPEWEDGIHETRLRYSGHWWIKEYCSAVSGNWVESVSFSTHVVIALLESQLLKMLREQEVPVYIASAVGEHSISRYSGRFHEWLNINDGWNSWPYRARFPTYHEALIAAAETLE